MARRADAQPLAIVAGRIRGLSVSDGKVRRDVSCFLEQFFGSSCFVPCSEADDGFGVFVKPVCGVAFDTQVLFSPSAFSAERSTHGVFDPSEAAIWADRDFQVEQSVRERMPVE